MKVIGIILVVFAYIMGLNAVFYYGILPAIGRVWCWADHGIGLILGLLGSLLLLELGNWLRNKAKKRDKQGSDSN